jgi:hypothetical protein
MQDPRLPEYSETGRNEAGAYINGLPWRSSPYQSTLIANVPRAYLQYVDSTGVTTLRIPRGYVVTNNDLESQSYGLSFSMNFDLIQRYQQGEPLPMAIKLDGTEAYGEVSDNLYVDTISCKSDNGMLYIRYIKTEDPSNPIVSGTFGFETNDQCGLHNITSGRFDFRFVSRRN